MSTKARDELKDKYPEPYFHTVIDETWDAVVKNCLKAAPEFNEKLAHEEADIFLRYADCTKYVAYVEGRRREHQQLAAQIGALREENAQLKKGRDGYAKAMAIALEHGIFTNKDEVKKLITAHLKDTSAPEALNKRDSATVSGEGE